MNFGFLDKKHSEYCLSFVDFPITGFWLLRLGHVRFEIWVQGLWIYDGVEFFQFTYYEILTSKFWAFG